MINQAIDPAWLAAVLAPWTVSPHPNFSELSPSGPALLALVTEGRGQDRENKYGSVSTESYASALIDSASHATQAGNQLNGGFALESIALDALLPFGARTAAALFASVAFAESENHSRGLNLLMTLLEDLRSYADGANRNPSLQLCGAALGLQATIRNMEVRRLDNAREELVWVKAVLPRGDHLEYEKFPVSKGISWGSKRVQSDISALLKANAASLEASLEDVWGGRWESIVRGRSGWLAMRQRLQDGKRDEAMLESLYERQFEATSGKIRFGGVSTTSYAWNALLSAELTSSWARIKSGREAYARILLLDGLSTPFNAQEALRLLRHSNSKDMLNVALRQVRSSGPLEALKHDTKLILERNTVNPYATASDLRVLQSGSELMTADERRRAAATAVNHLTTDDLFREALWTKQERVLKTLRSFLVGDNTDSLVADAALRVLPNLEGEENDPAVDALVRLVHAVKWESVTTKVRSAWSQWSKSASKTTGVSPSVVGRIQATLQGVPFSPSENDPLGQALDLVNGRILDVGDFGEAAESLVTALDEQLEEAKAGSRSFGGLDPFDLAVAFAIRFDTNVVWESIAKHISEPGLDTSQLGRGFDRLALSSLALPEVILRALRNNATRLLELAPDSGFFASPAVSPFPNALRLLTSEGIIADSDAMSAVTRMMSQGVLGRLEATKCSSRTKTASLSAWRKALLFQASFDEEPEIVAEAGLGLAANYDPNNTKDEPVSNRLMDLLKTNGVTVPMRVMQGLYRNPRLSGSAAVLSAVQFLGSTSLSRSVKVGASDLLRHLDIPPEF